MELELELEKNRNKNKIIYNIAKRVKMKILVLSDTHGNIDNARQVISENSDVSLIIHLGDYFRDAQKLKEEFPNIKIEYVYGNSDFMIDDTPADKILEVEGKRIFMTHGHRYSLKWGYDKLISKADEIGADILLFGHTHISYIVKNENCLILNPGSISDSRDTSGFGESYAIIEILNDSIKPQIQKFVKDTNKKVYSAQIKKFV